MQYVESALFLALIWIFFASTCCGKRKRIYFVQKFQYLLCYRSWVNICKYFNHSLQLKVHLRKYFNHGLQLQALKQFNIQVVRQMLKWSKSHPAGICFSQLKANMNILNTALLMHFEGQLLADKLVLRVTDILFQLIFYMFQTFFRRQISQNF